MGLLAKAKHRYNTENKKKISLPLTVLPERIPERVLEMSLYANEKSVAARFWSIPEECIS